MELVVSLIGSSRSDSRINMLTTQSYMNSPVLQLLLMEGDASLSAVGLFSTCCRCIESVFNPHSFQRKALINASLRCQVIISAVFSEVRRLRSIAVEQWPVHLTWMRAAPVESYSLAGIRQAFPQLKWLRRCLNDHNKNVKNTSRLVFAGIIPFLLTERNIFVPPDVTSNKTDTYSYFIELLAAPSAATDSDGMLWICLRSLLDNDNINSNRHFDLIVLNQFVCALRANMNVVVASCSVHELRPAYIEKSACMERSSHIPNGIPFRSAGPQKSPIPAVKQARHFLSTPVKLSTTPELGRSISKIAMTPCVLATQTETSVQPIHAGVGFSSLVSSLLVAVAASIELLSCSFVHETVTNQTQWIILLRQLLQLQLYSETALIVTPCDIKNILLRPDIFVQLLKLFDSVDSQCDGIYFGKICIM